MKAADKIIARLNDLDRRAIGYLDDVDPEEVKLLVSIARAALAHVVEMADPKVDAASFYRCVERRQELEAYLGKLEVVR